MTSAMINTTWTGGKIVYGNPKWYFWGPIGGCYRDRKGASPVKTGARSVPKKAFSVFYINNLVILFPNEVS